MKSSFLLRILAGCFGVAALWLVGCTDPTDVGSELLEDDLVQIKFTDTFDVEAYTRLGDTLTLYFPLTNFAQVEPAWLGQYDDPVFGEVRSSAYIQPRLPRTSSNTGFIAPEFFNESVDSIVLVLPYSNVPSYGPLTEPATLEILRITEQMDRLSTYNSDDEFQFNPVPLTTHTFTPDTDSTFVLEYFGEDIDTITYPHVRIPLPISFGTEIVNLDSLTLASDTSWLEQLPGLFIRQTNTTKGLLALNLSTTSAERPGIYIYHSRGVQDTTENMYQFPINGYSVRSYNFEHDYSDSPVENLIGPNPAIDTAVAVQGMEGVSTVLSFSNITSLKGTAINNAELEIFAIPTGDEADYSLPEGLTLLRRNSDGNLILIDDYQLIDFNSRARVFGGIPVEQADGSIKYTMKITKHLQDIIDENEPNELYLRVTPKAESAQRALLYGPNHTQYPIRLKVTYTEL